MPGIRAMYRLVNDDGSVQRQALGRSGEPDLSFVSDDGSGEWFLQRVLPPQDYNGERPLAIYRRQP